MTQGFMLVLQGQSETEKGSLVRTHSHCPDREETVFLGTAFSGATDCFCYPNISYWSRVNHEFIKERFNKITKFFSIILPIR